MTMHREELSTIGREAFDKIEFDSDEKLLYEVRKHPFGLFLIYLFGTFITISLLSVALGAASYSSTRSGLGIEGLQPAVVAVTMLLALLSLVMTAIAAWLYKSNVLLVSSDKVSQLLRPTLFHQKISQLSIGDVQDVTVHQKGIFPHMLNYGTIIIETAGEQQNYTFTFTPDPYNAAKILVGAHEENLKLHGN